jgi:hypothetical protein
LTYTAQLTATFTEVHAFAIRGGNWLEVSGVGDDESADVPVMGSDPEHAAIAVRSTVYTRPLMRESRPEAREPAYRPLPSQAESRLRTVLPP